MIKEIVATCLPQIAKEKGIAELGDRTSYIGASDVGQCPRKVIMGKLFPQPITIEQQIVFERGHLAENIVYESLVRHCDNAKKVCNKKVSAQVEVRYPGNDNIKAHIDFVLEDNGVKTVIENKTSTIVDVPYESWIDQCIFQQGLLKLENPEIKVDGYILCIDLKNGRIEEYKVEYDEVKFQELIKKAEYMLNLLDQKELDFNSIPTKQSVLCGYCEFSCDCPVYEDKENIPDDLKELIRKYSEKNINKKRIDKELDTLKEVITSYGPFKTVVDGIKANYTATMVTSLDAKAIKANEPELYEMYSITKEIARLTIS